MPNKIRFKRLISAIILPFILMSLLAYPAFAYSPADLQPYMQLEDSHMHSDELSSLALYLLDSSIMYYELAQYTGDMTFLNDVKPLINKTIWLMTEIEKVPSCGANVKGTSDSIKYMAQDDLTIFDAALANVNQTASYDSSKERALIAQFDYIDDIILNKINPLVEPSGIDIMAIGAMSFAVNAYRQAVVASIYNKMNPSSYRASVIEDAFQEAENQYELLVLLIQKSLTKTTDQNQLRDKKLILDYISEVRNQTNDLMRKVSQFDFSKVKKITLDDKFITTTEIMRKTTREYIYGVVFT